MNKQKLYHSINSNEYIIKAYKNILQLSFQMNRYSRSPHSRQQSKSNFDDEQREYREYFIKNLVPLDDLVVDDLHLLNRHQDKSNLHHSLQRQQEASSQTSGNCSPLDFSKSIPLRMT